MSVRILHGDAREMLRTLPDASVHCCVTSPPYWGLRDYGVAGQIGMERHYAEHIEALVDVFREVHRVLRDDGTLWLNYGDCYATSVNGRSAADTKAVGNDDRTFRDKPFSTVCGKLKPKDLVGMAWRVAFALQQPYHVGPIKDEVDRAWLAGLIDADGSIGVRVQNAEPGRTTNETFIPYLSVSQSDVAGLERCVRITGLGKINLKSVPSEDSRGIRSNRPFLTWRLDGQVASKVIRDIYPYLTIKQRQAQIVYAMNESLKWGRPTRSLPVPPDVVRHRRSLYELCKALNQRRDVTLLPLPDVPAATEPGWYLRQDNIWAKRNCMPESVRDRTTRAHEYMFMLTKSPRYFYDAVAIEEEGDIPAGTRAAKGSDVRSELKNVNGRPPKYYEYTGKRNKRSVWWIATQPFNGASLLADYVGADGKPYRRSPDCPIHGPSDRRRTPQTVGCGEPSNHQLRSSPGTDDCLGEEHVGAPDAKLSKPSDNCSSENPLGRDPQSTDGNKTPDLSLMHRAGGRDGDGGSAGHICDNEALPTGRDGDSDWQSQRSSLPATQNNNEIHRTDHEIGTNLAYSASAQTELSIGGTSALPELFDLAEHTPENSISQDGLGGGLSAQTPRNSERKSLRHYSGQKCLCEQVSVDHFATFPPDLIEPCILAGTSEKGCCSNCGAPWVRQVERTGEWRAQHDRPQKHDGNIYRPNPGGGIAGQNTDRRSVELGWLPSCRCDAGEPASCTVLDPFGGAGTTGLVADRLGRDAILIELNPEYAEMARRRIQSDAGLFAHVST